VLQIVIIAFLDQRVKVVEPFEILVYFLPRCSQCLFEFWVSGIRMNGEVGKNEVGMTEKQEIGLLIVTLAFVNVCLSP